MKSFTVLELNQLVKGELIGNTNKIITGPEELEKASENQVSIVGSPKYIKHWVNSKASVAVVNENLKIEESDNRAIIKVKNAELAMASILQAFSPEPPKFNVDIHPTAVIESSVKMGSGCKIGANCYVGNNVELGENVTLYAGVNIFDDSKIGNNTIVWTGTVIRERSIIGRNCIFHSNVSIGSDGFGYRPSDDGRGLVKIPHIGNVVIGDGVEIGANSAVDRAKFSSTIIGDGCKIDNLVQIAHNCVLGRSCIMAGSSGLAGSVTLGDGVIIGGSASIKDHVTIGSGAVVGGGSGVIGDIPAGKTVVGYPATDSKEMMKQWVALRKLGRN